MQIATKFCRKRLDAFSSLLYFCRAQKLSSSVEVQHIPRKMLLHDWAVANFHSPGSYHFSAVFCSVEIVLYVTNKNNDNSICDQKKYLKSFLFESSLYFSFKKDPQL